MNYLLERLEFSPGKFREQYLENLSLRCSEFVKLAAKPIRYDPESGDIIYPKDDGFKNYIEQDGFFIPERFNIVDLLLLECDIKSRGNFKFLFPSKTIISATDISNYTYCPVAWSIAKTYQLPKSASALIGSSMHEQFKLLHYVRSQKPSGDILQAEYDLQNQTEIIDSDSCSEELFKNLSESVAVFIGTSVKSDEKQYFYGTDGRYIGQPDYIFYNPRKNFYFAVEEKFHMIPKSPRYDFTVEWCEAHGYDPEAIDKKRQNVQFYDNHLNQL